MAALRVRRAPIHKLISGTFIWWGVLVASAAAQSSTPVPAAEAEVSAGESSATAAESPASESSSFVQQEISWQLPKIDAPWELCGEGGEAGKEQGAGNDEEEFRQSARLFIDHAQEWRRTARRHFDYVYSVQREDIDSRYQVNIDKFEEDEGEERVRAIERFQAFIDSHDSDPEYTPDALFRLGMLMLEQGDADFQRAEREYNQKLETAGDEELPDPPQRNHRRVIEIFSQLISRYPNYRDLDGVLYSRGHCYLEMSEDMAAHRDFKRVAKNYPEGNYYFEAWNLLGEHYFTYQDLPRAVEAYTQVLRDPQGPYFSTALYKLAWTHYRSDAYTDAVKRFQQFIEYNETRLAAGLRILDLQDEAIQYLANCLQAEDWDGDGLPDPKGGIDRVQRYIDGSKAYHAPLLMKLVKIFFDNSRYDEAIRTGELLFRLVPGFRENPKVHDLIIQSYDRSARAEQAFAARDQLIQSYSPGSPWYRENYRDQPAISEARVLTKDVLLQTGSYYQSQGRMLRGRAEELGPQGESLNQQASAQYLRASEIYRKYLTRYPVDKHTYDLLFTVGETLYFGGNYEGAAESYLLARDSCLDTKLRFSSAAGLLAAHDSILSARGENGSAEAVSGIPFESDPVESAAEGAEEAAEEAAEGSAESSTEAAEPEAKEGASPAAPKIPAVKAYPGILAQNHYIRKQLLQLSLTAPLEPPSGAEASVEELAEVKRDRDALVSGEYFNAGITALNHNRFAEARYWFFQVISRFPQSEQIHLATSGLVSSYQQTSAWDKIPLWADDFERRRLGGETARKLLEWKRGALFEVALGFEREEKFAEAAREFLRVAEELPAHSEVALALSRAAVAYENARRFESASQTYERIFREFPESEYSEEALYRVAYNAENFYNYDKARVTYRSLVTRYPSGRYGADALYNLALLLEQNQRYQEAAKTYEEYARRFSEREDAADALYQAGIVYERMGSWRRQIVLYENFERRFGRTPNQQSRVIEHAAKIARGHRKRGERGRERRAWQRVLDEFQSRGLQPGGPGSNFAAEATFYLIESDYKRYRSTKMPASVSRQRAVILQAKESLPRLIEAYKGVNQFRSADWIIAAFYRQGRIYQIFAQLLYDAPIPDSFGEEERDIYMTTLEEIAGPLEEKAFETFELAYEKAREFQLVNEWSDKLLTVLNQKDPLRYPRFRDELLLETPQQLSPTIQLPSDVSPLPSPEEESAEAGAARALPSEAEEPAAEEGPAEEGPAEEAPAEEGPAEEAPAEEGPAEEAPAEEAPAEEGPAEEAPAEEGPAEEGPAEEAPAEEAPTPTTDETEER
ncbi:MAG: tetratricopeptide repeat protein [Myxococcota bacterium]|nr:tetratricopeptide repeat protein [Myxococcota bacterium]